MESPIETPEFSNQKGKLKVFWEKISHNKYWRIIFYAVLTVLVFGSTSLGWYSYQKKQIYQKLGVSPESAEPADITYSPTTSPYKSATSTPTASSCATCQSSPTPTNSSDEPSSTPSSQVQAKTINDVATQFVRKSYGYCEALAPESWAITSNQEASGADLWSPDGKMHAGWGITFVYSYMYPTEDDFLNAWMPLAGYAGFSMGTSIDMGYGFTQRDFTANGKKGFIFYKKYDASDLGGYIMSVYMAASNSDIWDSEGATPAYAAISIRCVTQLRPDTSGTDPSSESSNSEVDMSDRWTEAIMGYENVYDSDTGDHYQAPTSSYWETGPDGPGYYKQSGNDLKKLQPGFGSY